MRHAWLLLCILAVWQAPFLAPAADAPKDDEAYAPHTPTLIKYSEEPSAVEHDHFQIS